MSDAGDADMQERTRDVLDEDGDTPVHGDGR
jgi:hypothetical protein